MTWDTAGSALDPVMLCLELSELGFAFAELLQGKELGDLKRDLYTTFRVPEDMVSICYCSWVLRSAPIR